MRDDELEGAFGFLAEQGLEAIRAGRVEELGAVLGALREALRVGLEALASYGIVLGPDAARQVLPSEWQVLSKPVTEYKRLLVAATRTEDYALIKEVLFWPHQVMRLALEKRDHFVFHQAANIMPYFYHLSKTDIPAISRELLRNRAWRRIQEFGTLEIGSLLDKASNAKTVTDLKLYAVELLDVYISLLKAALDSHDPDYFTEVARSYWHTTDWWLHHLDHGTHRGGSVNAEASQELETERAAEDFMAAVDARRGALWIALGGWLVRLFSMSKVDASPARAIFSVLLEPFKDFRQLWSAFLASLSHEDADRLPLSTWELSDHPEGRAVLLQPEQRLAEFFCLVALTNTPADAANRMTSLGVPENGSWVKGIVNEALTRVAGDQERWSEIIVGPAVPETGIAQATPLQTSLLEKEPIIRDLMDAVEADEKRRQRLKVMEQQVDPVKVDEFKRDFTEAWERGAYVRLLLRQAGAIVETEEVPEGQSRLGFWTLMSKEAFVAEPNALWLEPGRDFGNGMADAENKALIAPVRESTETVVLETGLVDERLLEIIESMRDEGLPPDAVLLSGVWDVIWRITSSSHYVAEHRIPGEHPLHFFGRFDEVPIYTIGVDDQASETEFLIVSLANLGVLTQVVGQDRSPWLRFEITGYSAEEARRIASEDKAWLPSDVRELPADEIVEYLREHVSIRIEQILSFKIVNAGASKRLVVPKSR